MANQYKRIKQNVCSTLLMTYKGVPESPIIKIERNFNYTERLYEITKKTKDYV